MSHPIFFYSSLGVSLPLIFFGSNATLRPEAHLKSLGFPLHTEPQAQKLNHALMRIWGIRNLTIGSLMALIWITGDEALMAKALCVCLPMPIVDGFVSRLLIGGGEAQHWSFPPVMAVIIAGLFGWFG